MDWLRGQVAVDDHYFLLTGRDVPRDDRAAHGGKPPFFLETGQPGIFAVGDVRSGSVERVASAIGEGAIAVRWFISASRPAEPQRPVPDVPLGGGGVVTDKASRVVVRRE